MPKTLSATRRASCALAIVLSLAAPAAMSAEPAAGTDAAGIAWQRAASDDQVDAAFALARRDDKPVFVYWGAKWCPPCNQVQATLFNRQDFIARSRAFVPVYVDGDVPGAQKLAARFKVRGYPTMVLFDARGTELTRLPGEVDAEQYTQLLTLGMAMQRPVKAVLADAQGDGAARLTPNEWRLLAFYSWDTDEQQLVPGDAVPALLRRLAASCPPAQQEASMRLLLKALAAAAPEPGAKGHKPGAPAPDAAARARVLALLADPLQARLQMDVLTNYAGALMRALGPADAALRSAYDRALARLADDASLSRADRMTAVIGRLELVEAAHVPVPAALQAQAREHSARADREITDGYERQAVITTAAYMLGQAGLRDESDALLKSNLARSHSPYYLMLGLADNAKKRGDRVGALRWYEQAYDRSEGPATRQQWGASYVVALVDLAPRDAPRIEAAVQRLLDEAAKQPDAFYERSGRSLKRVGQKLVKWNAGGAHAASFERLRTRLDGVCERIAPADPQRRTCDELLKPAG